MRKMIPRDQRTNQRQIRAKCVVAFLLRRVELKIMRINLITAPRMVSPTIPLPIRRWWHHADSTTAQWSLEWATSGVVAILNFLGEGELHWVGRTQTTIRPGTLTWLRLDGDNPLARAVRLPGKRHECLTVYFPDVWLRGKLSQITTPVSPEFEALLHGTGAGKSSFTRTLDDEQRRWAKGWCPPHLCEAAQMLLDEARLTEFLLKSLFSASENALEIVQTRTQRLGRERVERVKTILQNKLDEPPPLDQLAKAVGCTASYLSRTFSEVEGTTLSLWMRRTRVERAAELIASGKCNVSEAAVEVGYQSLSHFSRAFRDEKGVSPSQWTREGAR